MNSELLFFTLRGSCRRFLIALYGLVTFGHTIRDSDRRVDRERLAGDDQNDLKSVYWGQMK